MSLTKLVSSESNTMTAAMTTAPMPSVIHQNDRQANQLLSLNR